MPLKYIDQSVNNLNYIFIAKNIKIADYFNVICQRKYICHGGKLTVSIVGESHVIEFRNSQTQFTEILASIKDARLIEISSRLISISSLPGGLKGKYVYKKQHFRYSFSIKKEKSNLSVILKKLSGIKARLTSDDLLFEWGEERLSDSGIVVPSFTFIKHKFCKAGLIKIDTLHFYKNEGILITSRSIFKNIRMGHLNSNA